MNTSAVPLHVGEMYTISFNNHYRLYSMALHVLCVFQKYLDSLVDT